MAIMLPSLREERAQSYSPFLPLSPKSGKVLQVPILEIHKERGTVVFRDEDDMLTEVPVTGGHCKLQWKPDWGMRWHALGVDYEMSGKEHIPSVKLAGAICRTLGSPPPEGFNYELFLDDTGKKISKSVGNGLSVEEWLTYAPTESLALFMYQKPRVAKRLYFDVIPRAVDEYISWREKWRGETPEARFENPAFHVHNGKMPPAEAQAGPVDFSMLLNLASVCNAEDKHTLWGFISRYAPAATPESAPYLDKLVGHALAYYRDFVKPGKKYRAAEGIEREALQELLGALASMPDDAEAIQNHVYEIGKRYPFADLRSWFKALYEILLGQETGPRMGSFIALYGKEETAALIEKALKGGLVR
jgi:lysyl-tRNA synthetase class 1